MVVELSCVEVRESRRAMMFGGAQGRSGHKPDGHVAVFIWGPQVSKIEERIEVIRLLVQFEKNHLWNTSWIISALEAE